MYNFVGFVKWRTGRTDIRHPDAETKQVAGNLQVFILSSSFKCGSRTDPRLRRTPKEHHFGSDELKVPPIFLLRVRQASCPQLERNGKRYLFCRCPMSWVHRAACPAQFDSELRDTSVRHRRFLGQDECPEFAHDPDAYDEEFLWSCLPCWRRRDDRDRTHQTGCWAPLPEVEQHIADK